MGHFRILIGGSVSFGNMVAQIHSLFLLLEGKSELQEHNEVNSYHIYNTNEPQSLWGRGRANYGSLYSTLTHLFKVIQELPI